MKFDLMYEYIKDEKITDLIMKDFENFFNGKSQTFKLLSYFIVNKTGSAEDIAEIDEFKDLQISVLLGRLAENEKINAVSKNGKFIIYEIANKGKIEIERAIKSFLDKNYDYKEFLDNKRKEKIEVIHLNDKIKTILNGIVDSNIKPNLKDEILINMKDLSEINPETTDLIYAEFENSLEIIKQHFKEDISNISINNILIENIHESEFRGIHNYDRDTKQLIYTKGLVTSKKEQIVSKILKYSYLCINPSCNISQNKISSISKLKSCPKCKSAVELIEEERTNQLSSKITDIETGISFIIKVYGKKSEDFSFIGLGDEIEVIGYLEDHIVESKEKISNEVQKVLVVNNFKTTDYTKDLSKEEIDLVDRTLSKYEDTKEYMMLPFRDYIEQEWVKELLIIQQLSRFNPKTKETPLNLAICGEPGVGKNMLIQIGEEYFPNCDAIVGADITDAGFKGTVNRDTGIKEIGMAKKCQAGTIFFNEFDKFVKSNINGKKGASQLLNASITEQEIRLNKAGIRIRMRHLDLRHNIIFNPLEEKIASADKIPYDYMGQILDKSLLSRMLPIYIGKDSDRSRKVFDLMLKPNSKIKNLDKNTYKLVVRHLRGKEITMTLQAQETLKDIFCNLIKKDTYNAISVERIGQMLIQMSYGVCRMHNKDKCDKSSVKIAYDLYLKCLKSVGITLDNLEMLFMDKSPEDIKTIIDIKLYIEKEFINKQVLKVEDLEKLFDKDLLQEALNNLKRDSAAYEPRKGELRRLE